jgi:hypothetical protein
MDDDYLEKINDTDDDYLEKINDTDDDIKCRHTCGCLFNWKRFFLPLAIILPIFIIFEKLQNDIYIFLSCLVSSFILTWNFPYFSKYGYMRPIYFEDLEQDNLNYKKIIKKKIITNIEASAKFQNKFILFQQLILSITMALIIDYSTHRYKDTTLVFTEILGLMGGLLSLYLKITKFIGKLILKILYLTKKKERDTLINEMKKTKEYVKRINMIEFKENHMIELNYFRKSSSESCLSSPRNN